MASPIFGDPGSERLDGRTVTQPQLQSLKIISLSMSLVSLASCFFAMYWFLRMRRSFRHDLIMLLIQSDVIKSATFMIYPLVHFTHGHMPSNSAFCQASGFFFALGIEASDIAVLLIALHSVLYILYPRRSSGEHGLYPYRRVAYAAYVTYPVLMASLAFLNGVPGYVNTGEYCYLATSPSWYRQALSWIPRYVIMTSLLVIYTCLYAYVCLLMRRYSRRSSEARSSDQSRHRRANNILPSPPLAYHGLIPSTPSSRRSSNAVKNIRQNSASSDSIKMGHPISREQRVGHQRADIQKPQWTLPGFKHESRRHHDRLDSEIPPDRLPADRHSVETLQDAPLTVHFSRVVDINADSNPSCSPSPVRPEPPQRVFQRQISAGQSTQHAAQSGDPGVTLRPTTSLPHIMDMLRRGPSRASGDESLSPSAIFISPEPSDSFNSMGSNRERVRRQLRLLFVYPLVYLIIWVFPFVSDVGRYNDLSSKRSPFWLVLLSLISLCIQGTVDSILFSVWEQPWRHTRGGFWESVGLRLALDLSMVGHTVGRTREEMLDEERLARGRRQEEEQHERATRLNSEGRPTRRAGDLNWWDVEADGAGASGIDSEEEDIDMNGDGKRPSNAGPLA